MLPSKDIAKSNKEIADKFNTYFLDKVTNIRKTFGCVKPPNPSNSVGVPKWTSFISISLESLKRIINNLKNKQCILDPVPAKVLKVSMDILMEPLQDIINMSLHSGIFPSNLKSALVRPVLKKANLDPCDLVNYRPVSNLPYLSKILETVVVDQFLAHVHGNGLLTEYQSAYRRGHSCETALLRVHDSIWRSLDAGVPAMLIMLDISSAYDTIDHQILLSTLRTRFGITGTPLSWIESFLTDRSQSVMVRDAVSDHVPVPFGSPQGSKMSCQLFVAYMQPLADLLESFGLDMAFQVYADDHQLMPTCQSRDIHVTMPRINHIMRAIKEWMNKSCLKLNDSKTEVIIFTRPSLKKYVPASITILDGLFQLKDCVKNLGVNMDSALTMETYVSNMCRKANFQLAKIRQIRHGMSNDVAKQLVNWLVIPHLQYCNSLLVGTTKEQLLKLQRTQNAAIRTIFKLPKYAHVSGYYRQLGWLNMESNIKYRVLSLVHGCLNGTAPKYLQTLISVNVPNRTLRSCGAMLLNVPRINSTCKGFSVQGPKLFNALPLCIRLNVYNRRFLRDLKLHLLAVQ